MKLLDTVVAAILKGSGWKKFANPTVGRGLTAWPTTPRDHERYGVRYVYDGEKVTNGVRHHKFQMKANAGNNVPFAIKIWRSKAKNGIHMADVFVPAGGEKNHVKAALEKAHEEV